MRGVILTALVLATLAGGAGWWPAPPPEARPLADGRVDAVDAERRAAKEGGARSDGA